MQHADGPVSTVLHSIGVVADMMPDDMNEAILARDPSERFEVRFAEGPRAVERTRRNRFVHRSGKQLKDRRIVPSREHVLNVDSDTRPVGDRRRNESPAVGIGSEDTAYRSLIGGADPEIVH